MTNLKTQGEIEKQNDKIIGYRRKLSDDEIEVMNTIKAVGNEYIDPLVQAVTLDLAARFHAGEIDEATFTKSKLWIDTADIDLRKGLMGLTRSVAKPDFY